MLVTSFRMPPQEVLAGRYDAGLRDYFRNAPTDPLILWSYIHEPEPLINSGEFTVFAPVDSAFAQVPASTLDALKTDTEGLTALLTYHVVPGQAGPDKVTGEHKTVEGSMLTVTGSGDDTKVNGAGVICGGVKTANATVYLIDQVLMPPADQN